MKKHPKLIPTALALCAFAFSSAQAQRPQDHPDDEDIVRLSPFDVRESGEIGRYQAVETTSSTRVRASLMDMTQSVSVVTNEFLTDTASGRVGEALRYVAGVSSTAESHALDTMYVRGFFAQGSTIDGFYSYNYINQDPIVIERLEVVKGPNAILSPQGLPGGIVNSVSKRPLFTKSAYKGHLSYQAGRRDANRTELDVNYVARRDKLAVRVVGAVTDSDEYGKDNFQQNITVMPMFTYRLSQNTDFTLQAQAYNAWALADNGRPLSVYAVGRNNVRVAEGLPRDFQVEGRNITRHQSGQHIRLFLNSQLTDKLSMRIVGNLSSSKARTIYLGSGVINGDVIDLDHITGEWFWDGVKRNDNPLYKLSGQTEWIKRNYANLQNDYSYEHRGRTWKSQTVGGFAVNYSSGDYKFKLFEDIPTIYDFRTNYTPPAYTNAPDYLAASSSWGRSVQFYVAEVVSLFEDRLVLSASLSHTRNNDSGRNNVKPVPDPDELPTVEPKKHFTVPAAGVVYKVTPEVSLYYGFTKQELPGGENPREGIPPHTVPSRQHEGGVRVRLFEGKLYATLAYFDILQENLIMANWGNYRTPRPDPPLPSILTQRTAKGVELEFTWAVTKDLSVLGSYTQFKNRDFDNARFPGAEEMGGIWGRYTFPDSGPLRNLSLAIGASYVGESPADAVAGTSWRTQYTEPPPGNDPVRIKPSFWLPSYVVWEATASYRFKKNWQATLLVKNLFDKEYLTFSFLRTVQTSWPINPKLVVRYEF